MLSLIFATMAISPWNGSDMRSSSSQTAAKYRLTVAGTPGRRVVLSATRVAPGWIAAFCDDRDCKPTHATHVIPHSGSLVMQFVLVRETQDAPHRSGAIIASSDGSRVTVPDASR